MDYAMENARLRQILAEVSDCLDGIAQPYTVASVDDHYVTRARYLADVAIQRIEPDAAIEAMLNQSGPAHSSYYRGFEIRSYDGVSFDVRDDDNAVRTQAASEQAAQDWIEQFWTKEGS
jgi:hypothetical protein